MSLWIIILVGLSIVAWSVFSVQRIFFPERRTLTPPSPLPAYTTHTLSAADGSTFDVWLLEPPSPRGRLLVCHGYYANRYQVLALAHRLRERGYEVLLFELRGHGSRPGPCTLGIKEAEDAIAILQWASRERVNVLPLGVLGFSMGAVIACHMARQVTEVRAVVTDSVYPKLFPIIKRAMWRRYHVPSVPFAWITWWALQLALGKRLGRCDPMVIATHLRQPLLAIQGGADQQITSHEGDEFFQRWAGPKEQWVDSAVVHVGMFAQHPEAYVNRVATFFDRALS